MIILINKKTFLNGEVPKPLEREELYHYFERMRLGDKSARNMIILHNIRLVMYYVDRMSPNICDWEELISIGLIGLIKSVDTFDINRGVSFSTYACKYIKSGILKFLSANIKYSNYASLEQQFNISDKCDIELECEKRELCERVRTLVYQLPNEERSVIMKYFGFPNHQPMVQREIAEELGLSRSNVQRILARGLKRIEVQLEARTWMEQLSLLEKEKRKAHHLGS